MLYQQECKYNRGKETKNKKKPKNERTMPLLELQEVQKAAEGQVAYAARQVELDRNSCEGAPDAWSEAGSCTSAVEEL